ncbi:MAG: hypothetical protein ACYDEX_06195 [Mobilitalea sp.]
MNIKGVNGADGYGIYMSESKDDVYKKIKVIKVGATLPYVKTGLVDGKTYCFKVRAYKKMGSKAYWGAYSDVKTIKVGESSGEEPKVSADYLKRLKEQEEEVIEVCMNNEWDPNGGSKYPLYQVLSISFIDLMSDGWMDLVVRSSYSGEDNPVILKVYSITPHGFTNSFTYPENTTDGNLKSSFKMYKNKTSGGQFFIGHFIYDSSGANGQIGTRFNEYYNMSIWDDKPIMGAYYQLNYHKLVGDDGDNSFVNSGSTTSAADYKKSEEKYFNNLTLLNYKETTVSYDATVSSDERRKALIKAYEANFN